MASARSLPTSYPRPQSAQWIIALSLLVFGWLISLAVLPKKNCVRESRQQCSFSRLGKIKAEGRTENNRTGARIYDVSAVFFKGESAILTPSTDRRGNRCKSDFSFFLFQAVKITNRLEISNYKPFIRCLLHLYSCEAVLYVSKLIKRLSRSEGRHVEILFDLVAFH